MLLYLWKRLFENLCSTGTTAVRVVRLVTMLILFSDSGFNAMVTGAWLTVLSVTATGSITLQTVLISVTHRPCSTNASLNIKRIRLPNVICWHDCTGMMHVRMSVPPLSPGDCPRSPHTGWGDMERGPGSPRNMGSGSPQPSAATKSSHTVGQEKKSSRAIAGEITILLTFTVPDPLFQTMILSSMSMPSLTVCI